MKQDVEGLPVREFDYVVVGAGSSGCVVAARLAQAGSGSVAVIEAGQRRWPKITAIPAAMSRVVGHRAYDWLYRSQPDPTRNDRTEIWPRGKGPGGSSLVNGMIFVRGSPTDYDAWEAAGATGWSYADVLPYFRRLETSEYDGQARGALGPQTVSKLRYQFALTQPFLDAAGHAGIPYNPDINGPQQDGVGHVQAVQKNGRRQSAFDSFLAPAVRDGSVTLIEKALTHRVLFESRRATGVLIERGERKEVVRARRLVVLSAGAINSPHLLMLSGIGPAAMLRRHGIDLVHNAPEVGANLMEHPAVWLRTEVDTPTLNQVNTPFGIPGALVQWLGGRGPATAATAQAVAFVRSQDDHVGPDIQLHLCPYSLVRSPTGAAKMPPRKLMGVVPSVNHPASRGTIELASSAASDAPLIKPRLLDAQADLDTLGRGIRLCQTILATDPLARHVVRIENAPPPLDAPKAELESYMRELAAPLYHPVGTCRMGDDLGSVLDPLLCVRGVEGLAVADASVMPRHISGNTHAASMMIGEKAADMFITATRRSL